ncbi:sugar phosphate isomerase/epimerase family protein [Terriglobus roseus]|uniref:Sugar phosphate isomerase/epimerase n=1 Tax=Terriglobus roseus TaxID=392734 RepID=A0A1G7NQQ8_9BACT|nr:sugar phosphate isomerase/epimerase [Terriglobus roseus]SDF76291.1 Sugar phosphate isomerase/epimerase [Terriglobus roseus]
MTYTRRQFGKLAATTLPFAAAAASYPRSLFAQGKPNSVFSGVQVGIITAYSYHNMPDDARSLVSYMVRDGISATESHDEPLAEFLGAPKAPARPRPVAAPAAGAGRPASVPPAGEPRAPRAPSPEQLAYQEALNKWRLATPPAKFEEVRKLYNDAGIWIYGFKMSLTNAMPDELYDWTFEVVKVLGANQLTMEMPDGDSALTARIGKFALKHKTRVGYHAHLQATPTTWDEAMSQSPYNCINLDIGHYTAAGNHDAVAFVQKNHERITSVHLKDRKFKENGGANMPWGQGDTPIKEVLALMKKDKYKFPATIELEYQPPEGSNSEKEIVKCLAYAKAALA